LGEKQKKKAKGMKKAAGKNSHKEIRAEKKGMGSVGKIGCASQGDGSSSKKKGAKSRLGKRKVALTSWRRVGLAGGERGGNVVGQ